MKKGVKIITIIIVLLAIIYGIGCLYFKNNVIFNTTIYHHQVSEYSEANIKKVLDDEKIVLNVPDKRKNISIALKDLDYTIIDPASIKDKIISEQNIFLWPITIIKGQNYDVAQINIKQNDIASLVSKYKVIQNDGLTKSVDASLSISSDGVVKIKSEVVGQQLDKDKVVESISKNLLNGNIDIDLSSAIIRPNVTKTMLEEMSNIIDSKLNIPISITLKGTKTIINPSKADKIKWLTIDYKNKKIDIDKEKIIAYLDNINNNIIAKNSGSADVYKAANGSISLVKKGTPTQGIDVYVGLAQIYNAMQNNVALDTTDNTVAIVDPKIEYEGHPSSDNSFVEVSISAQKLYLYQNGKLIYTADVVTGLPDGDKNTPKGSFNIIYKTTNFTMRGEDYGYDYVLKVSYWMPFTSGVGLHDAPWRTPGTFGGKYYLTSGSHGCVNMKLKDVAFVYKHVDAGTAVWVH
ncbi:MAG: L,D-transpeptidase [Bacilli bacterium]|jgi:lipoprotein-anchoring transpeptidase ErfK/SrfK|nr:L,D-transpeptidase [Bacilli bacterium]